MESLANRRCVPCRGGSPPLGEAEIGPLLMQLGGGWSVIEGRRLEREFAFKNFREALDFTNRVGQIAEAEGHHPDICLSWGKAKVTLYTHKIGGLSESDFIMAAKISQITR